MPNVKSFYGAFGWAAGFRFFPWLAFLLLVVVAPHAVAQPAAPTITTQPQNLTLNPGSSGLLTVTASGTGTLSYRWFNNGTALTDGGGLTGTLTATLSFAAAQTSDGGNYSVVVSNSGGSVTSNTVTLTVAIIYAPVISSANSLSVPPSAPMSFTVVATNSPRTFGATGLPPGLAIDPSTGVISGTPTLQGISSVVLSATNGIGTITQDFTLTVETALPSYADKLLVGGFSTSPSGLAIDSANNIFVADAGNHTIVKVTSVAGTNVFGKAGQGGSTDGVGAAALFLSPGGVTVDGSGNVYVADTGNHTIRKITPDGTVSTFAGSAGQGGSADGIGSAARFFSPQGIAADAVGTLYIADTGNHTIRKITTAGIVSTLAGSPGVSGNADGTSSIARFNLPNSLALDGAGAIYVADGANNRVRKVSAAGAVTTLPPTFSQPSGIAFDGAGNLFVAATNNNALAEITPVGTVRTFAPLGGTYQLPTPPSGISAGTFPTYPGKPKGMVCDSAGNFYWLNTASGPSLSSPFGLHKATPFFPVVITSPPQRQTVVSGTNAQFSVTATGQPLNYAWYGPLPFKKGAAGLSAAYLDSTTSSVSVAASLQGLASGTYITNEGTYGVIVYNVGSSAIATAQLSITPRPPIIFSPPKSLTVVAGQSATFSVFAANSDSQIPAFSETYVWNFNGAPILGASGPSYTIANAQAANAGSYTVTITENTIAGPTTITSDPATLTVNQPEAPQITAQPQSLTVKASASASFSVIAVGTPAPTYQWSFNGTPIVGATSATYALASAQPANAGNYQVTATNSAGTVTSSSAAFVIVSLPVVASAPQAKTVYAGNPVTFSVTASGLSLNYQWQLNGVAIAGATDATLTLPNAQAVSAGSYTVLISNLAGSVTTAPAALDVITTRLVNLSARGPIGGGNILIVGFVTNGSASKQLLIRGIGPTLAAFGVSNALSAPQLTLFDSQPKVLGVNGGWVGAAALADAFGQVGAFALPTNSADSALLRNLPAGLYSAQLSGVGSATGVGLAEIYDADSGTPAPRLVNLSASGFVGTGGNVLIAGLAISGNRPAKILVRAIGPTLSSFGVGGALATPQLMLFDSTGKTVATSTAWGGDTTLNSAFTQVGAFALPLSSNDSALLATVPPGSYTALVNGVGGTTGVALVEVYEVP